MSVRFKLSFPVNLETGVGAVADQALDLGETREFTLDDCAVVVRKDFRGSIDVKVRGLRKHRHEIEINRVAKDISEKILQRIVCERIKETLEEKGFRVATENMEKDRSIRLIMRRSQGEKIE